MKIATALLAIVALVMPFSLAAQAAPAAKAGFAHETKGILKAVATDVKHDKFLYAADAGNILLALRAAEGFCQSGFNCKNSEFIVTPHGSRPVTYRFSGSQSLTPELLGSTVGMAVFSHVLSHKTHAKFLHVPVKWYPQIGGFALNAFVLSRWDDLARVKVRR